MNKRSKILKQIIKDSIIYKAVIGYLIYFAVSALLIMLFEPSVIRYGDALWYCFVSCTTIGFGDIVAVTLIGRILTVLLYIYTIIVIALITALTTQFFIEVAKARRDESVSLFLHDLEHLSSLPPEKLAEISEKVKSLRNK